ncbi:MAG: aminotransferase class III-fold pyridoxal phosphate-dependent enzyme [Elusimicrobia bacterium]|nr:aminotransferase class III-fold pyridoxal phosphate-dependent enzyme [Elusimicrobiota bacterium]
MSPKIAAERVKSTTAADASSTAAVRAAHLMPLPGPMFAKPIQIVEGKMQFLYDENGKEYLDGFAGVATVSIGHSHPHFVAKLKAQIDKLQHNPPLYLHPSVGAFAKRLADKAKTVNSDMELCFFTNSGPEANEMATFIAKTYTPTDYAYRFDGTPEQSTKAALRGLEMTLKSSTSGKLAGFFAETIMGVGGSITPGKAYFGEAVELVHKHGGLFICDEVQAGVGRTGDHYFGIKHWGAVPDILVMAKGLANGYPIGAVITTRAIADSMKGLLHYNTFGGGPMAMAAASAVMDVVENENLAENARKVGDRLLSGLRKLQQKFEQVGDVRGMGLMVGVEIVKDKKSRDFAPDLAMKIVESMKDQGVLVGKGGMEGNTVRIKPPLCWTNQDADRTVAAFEQALKG